MTVAFLVHLTVLGTWDDFPFIATSPLRGVLIYLVQLISFGLVYMKGDWSSLPGKSGGPAGLCLNNKLGPRPFLKKRNKNISTKLNDFGAPMLQRSRKVVTYMCVALLFEPRTCLVPAESACGPFMEPQLLHLL